MPGSGESTANTDIPEQVGRPEGQHGENLQPARLDRRPSQQVVDHGGESGSGRLLSAAEHVCITRDTRRDGLRGVESSIRESRSTGR